MQESRTIKILIIVSIVSSLAYAHASDVYSVALARLLVDRSEFVGKRIVVTGYLARTTHLGIFLTRDHAEVYDWASSIAVSDDTSPKGRPISDSTCVSSYVKIVATLFEDEQRYPMLIRVEKVSQPSLKRDCWTGEIKVN